MRRSLQRGYSSRPPVTGKTHLSIALGTGGTRGEEGAFATPHQWVNRLGAAKRAERLAEECERLGRVPVFIVAEVGYIPFDLGARGILVALISSTLCAALADGICNRTFGAWAGNLRRSSQEVLTGEKQR